MFSLRPYLSLLHVEGGEDRTSDGREIAVGRGTIRKLVVSIYLITPGYFLIGNKEALQKDPTRRQRQAARRRKAQTELASPNRPSPRRHHHPYN